MINEKKYIAKIKKAKFALKRKLIKLSYYEKLKMMVEMQKRSKKLSKNKNKKVYVWNID